MSPYRQPGQPGHGNRRRAVIFQARHVRAALIKRGALLLNILDQVVDSREIIDALTGCIDELELDEQLPEVPF